MLSLAVTHLLHICFTFANLFPDEKNIFSFDHNNSNNNEDEINLKPDY